MEQFGEEYLFWKEKLTNAIAYINKKKVEISDKISLLDEELYLLEQQINGLVQVVNKSHTTKSSQLELFSPYETKHDNEDSIELANELECLNHKVTSLQSKYESYIKEQAEIDNLSDCALRFNEYREIYYEEMNHNNSIAKPPQVEKMGERILRTQEIERKRIARDLHDSTVQNLASVIHKIELCSKLMDMDPIRAKLELATMTETIRTTINGMREIIYDLRPMTLNDIGLVATVNQYFQKIKQDQKMQVVFDIKGKEKEKNIPSVVNLTLYRIIQEACNNMIKYANASTLSVKIIYEEDSIEVIIIDDGIGFSVNNIVHTEGKNHGFGLSIMKERVYLLSGTIEMRSEKDKGTQIYIKVPYDNNRGDEIDE